MAPIRPAKVPGLATITLYCCASATACAGEGFSPPAMFAATHVRMAPPPAATPARAPFPRRPCGDPAVAQPVHVGTVATASARTTPAATLRALFRRIPASDQRTKGLIDTALSP